MVLLLIRMLRHSRGDTYLFIISNSVVIDCQKSEFNSSVLCKLLWRCVSYCVPLYCQERYLVTAQLHWKDARDIDTLSEIQ